jgi:hypothetical protein
VEVAIYCTGRTVGNEGEYIKEHGLTVEKEGLRMMFIAFYDWVSE